MEGDCAELIVFERNAVVVPGYRHAVDIIAGLDYYLAVLEHLDIHWSVVNCQMWLDDNLGA